MTDETASAPRLVVGIRFRPTGQIHEFDPGPLHLAVDDRVLVDTERGPALGTVASAPRRRPAGHPLQRIVKKADVRDLAREDRARQLERELQHAALGLIKSRGVPLKLVRAEAALDGSRVTVFVTGDEKVDARELVHELGAVVKMRVEVRQLGARDEARAAGGLGICGRELCCSSWLREFAPVSVKMAKAQDLALNPAKLAGQCGRLKCCMRYEYETYLELKRGLPPIGTEVQSVEGDGKIVGHRLLAQTVIVRRHEDGVHLEATLEDLVAKRETGA